MKLNTLTVGIFDASSLHASQFIHQIHGQ